MVKLIINFDPFPFQNALPIESFSKNATEQVEISPAKRFKTESETNRTIPVNQRKHFHFELNDTQLHQLLKFPSRAKLIDQNDTVIVAVNSKVKGHILKKISHTVTEEELQFLNDTIFEMNNTKGTTYLCLDSVADPRGFKINDRECFYYHQSLILSPSPSDSRLET